MSFVIVSYNGRDLLRACLRSVIEQCADTEPEIVVVDNASTDDIPAMVRSEFPGVELIESSTNAGFGAANNAGIARTSGRLVFLLNPDTELTFGCVESLVDAIDRRSDVAVVAPLLLNDDGTTQRSIRRFPTVRGQLAELLFLHTMLARVGISVGEVDYVDANYTTQRDVEWVTGAAMLVRRDALVAVGGFDEAFFLYSEEKDLCYRLSKAGRRIMFVPDSKVRHRGAGSGTSPWLFAELTKSRCLFYTRHHSRIEALVYRGILAVQYGLRALGWYARSFAGGVKNEAARKKSASYWFGTRAAMTPTHRQPNWVILGSQPKTGR